MISARSASGRIGRPFPLPFSTERSELTPTARSLEIPYVSGVQQVEGAVGEHDPPPRGFLGSRGFEQRRAREDLRVSHGAVKRKT